MNYESFKHRVWRQLEFGRLAIDAHCHYFTASASARATDTEPCAKWPCGPSRASAKPKTRKGGNRWGHALIVGKQAAQCPSLGIVIDGVTRDLERLSVGTNEQIATLLRLTIAEHLESAIILDDQLTQTDAQRGEHFRKLLRDQGAKSQIIVITCQPLSYVDRSEMPKNGDAMVERAAGLVRVIDLEQVIDRA
jgi:hypothetical protein